jgi:hypothetical protein
LLLVVVGAGPGNTKEKINQTTNNSGFLGNAADYYYYYSECN